MNQLTNCHEPILKDGSNVWLHILKDDKNEGVPGMGTSESHVPVEDMDPYSLYSIRLLELFVNFGTV